MKEDRIRRRKYPFTEDDFVQIVKRGQLPLVSELLICKGGGGQEQSDQRNPSLTDVEPKHTDLNDRTYGIQTARDHNETFITSLGFIDSTTAGSGEGNKESLDWFLKYTDIEHFDSALPSTLCESVKALRLCLRNPGSLWRIQTTEDTSKLQFKLTSKLPHSKTSPELPKDELEEMGELLNEVSQKLGDMERRLNEVMNK
jgi:hypothetical protein